jgi:hypothetical protein
VTPRPAAPRPPGAESRLRHPTCSLGSVEAAILRRLRLGDAPPPLLPPPLLPPPLLPPLLLPLLLLLLLLLSARGNPYPLVSPGVRRNSLLGHLGVRVVGHHVPQQELVHNLQ